jgi:hypothetical protein
MVSSAPISSQEQKEVGTWGTYPDEDYCAVRKDKISFSTPGEIFVIRARSWNIQIAIAMWGIS